jgi:hypothetical protein
VRLELDGGPAVAVTRSPVTSSSRTWPGGRRATGNGLVSINDDDRNTLVVIDSKTLKIPQATGR